MHSNIEEIPGRYERPRGYCHCTTIDANNPDWMSKLPDKLKFSEMNLPGTHDTIARHGGDAVCCNKLGLKEQLNAGIRVLDIRPRLKDDKLMIYHGFVNQKMLLADVFKITTDFLRENTSETVYMRIKKEYKMTNNTKEFYQVYEEVIADFRDLIWLPANSSSPNNPPLSETRGKIVVLVQFPRCEGYGINWGNFSKQDQYNIGHNWQLYQKWEAIKEHAIRANQDTSETIYFNFLSGSGLSFPYFIASGQSSHQTRAPRLLTGHVCTPSSTKWKDLPRKGPTCLASIAFEGTNNLLINFLKSNTDIKKVGCIMADFHYTSKITIPNFKCNSKSKSEKSNFILTCKGFKCNLLYAKRLSVYK